MSLAAVFGRNVRKARESRGLSIESLAHDAKLSYSYVGQIELGKRNPTLTVVARISAALDIEPSVLMEEPSSLSQSNIQSQRR